MSHERISNNYIKIVGSARELGLKGNELIVFSVINSFSRTENMWFTGSTTYLCEWTGASKKTVIEILKKLVDKGYIIRGEKDGFPIYRTYKFYKATSGEAGAKGSAYGEEITPLSGVKITPPSGEEITPLTGVKTTPLWGGVEITPGGVKTTPNNNIYIDYPSSSLHSLKSVKEEDIYSVFEQDNFLEEVGLPFE